MTDDWKLFGLSLGVPRFKLDTIKLDDPNGGVENWKLKMFKYWLQLQQEDPSWKDIIRALKENNFTYLAVTLVLSRKYLSVGDSSEDEGISHYSTLGRVSLLIYIVIIASLSNSDISTNKDDKIETEIQATAAVVKRLRDLESSFTDIKSK